MRPAKGFTLIELLLSAILSAIVVLALISGLLLFTSRAAQEQGTERLQTEVELTLRWVSLDIEEANALLPVDEFIDIKNLPGTVTLALVVPQAGQYTIVLYLLGALPKGFPYTDPDFQKRYGALRGALYRWQSPPFKRLQDLPAKGELNINPTRLQLISPYVQPLDTRDPGQSGLVFVAADDNHGGLLIVNGLRPLELRRQAQLCTPESTTLQCKPLTRELYVYAKNIAAADLDSSPTTATTPVN